MCGPCDMASPEPATRSVTEFATEPATDPSFDQFIDNEIYFESKSCLAWLAAAALSGVDALARMCLS